MIELETISSKYVFGTVLVLMLLLVMSTTWGRGRKGTGHGQIISTADVNEAILEVHPVLRVSG